MAILSGFRIPDYAKLIGRLTAFQLIFNASASIVGNMLNTFTGGVIKTYFESAITHAVQLSYEMLASFMPWQDLGVFFWRFAWGFFSFELVVIPAYLELVIGYWFVTNVMGKG